MGKYSLYEFKNKSIGEKIAIMRHLLGYTQIEFCDIINIARGTLVKVEKTKDDRNIGIEVLYRIYYYLMNQWIERQDNIVEPLEKCILTLAKETKNDVEKVIKSYNKSTNENSV